MKQDPNPEQRRNLDLGDEKSPPKNGIDSEEIRALIDKALRDGNVEELTSILGVLSGEGDLSATKPIRPVDFEIEREGEELTLTPRLLTTAISPFFTAIGDIQRIINEIWKQPFDEVNMISITQHSPISVSLEGAAEAVEVVRYYHSLAAKA